MQLQIKYFGMLAEITGCSEETLSFSGGTVSELLREIYSKYPHLKDRDFQVAQQQEFVSNETVIDQLEIALLPPFSGG